MYITGYIVIHILKNNQMRSIVSVMTSTEVQIDFGVQVYEWNRTGISI